MRALGIDTADLGVEMTTRKILDAKAVRRRGALPQTLTAWEDSTAFCAMPFRPHITIAASA